VNHSTECSCGHSDFSVPLIGAGCRWCNYYWAAPGNVHNQLHFHSARWTASCARRTVVGGRVRGWQGTRCRCVNLFLPVGRNTARSESVISSCPCDVVSGLKARDSLQQSRWLSQRTKRTSLTTRISSMGHFLPSRVTLQRPARQWPKAKRCRG
jgi:hypothetical protein